MCPSKILLSLTALAVLATCAAPYKSLYRETNHQQRGTAISPNEVRVVQSRADLSGPQVELGVYRGQAPTIDEAMDAAKRECGNHGANLFVLNTEPFASESVWKVDGVCAVEG